MCQNSSIIGYILFAIQIGYLKNHLGCESVFEFKKRNILKAKGDDGTSIGNQDDIGCRHLTFSDFNDQFNSMCFFMQNIFMSTKYIQNSLENLEEAFISSKKRGIGISIKGFGSANIKRLVGTKSGLANIKTRRQR